MFTWTKKWLSCTNFWMYLIHLCMQYTFLKTLVNGCMAAWFMLCFFYPDNDSIITGLQIHLCWQSCPEDTVTLTITCYNSKTKWKQNKFNNMETPDISWELVASLFMASEWWQSEWWQSEFWPCSLVSAIELLYQYSVQRNQPESRTTLIQSQWQHYFLSHLWSLIQM